MNTEKANLQLQITMLCIETHVVQVHPRQCVPRIDEDDSHAPPKRMTNEDVMRMQCRIAIGIVFTYSLHAKQYSAMRQYTSAQKR